MNTAETVLLQRLNSALVNIDKCSSQLAMVVKVNTSTVALFEFSRKRWQLIAKQSCVFNAGVVGEGLLSL
jgi:hypothetical protein